MLEGIVVKILNMTGRLESTDMDTDLDMNIDMDTDAEHGTRHVLKNKETDTARIRKKI